MSDTELNWTKMQIQLSTRQSFVCHVCYPTLCNLFEWKLVFRLRKCVLWRNCTYIESTVAYVLCVVFDTAINAKFATKEA